MKVLVFMPIDTIAKAWDDRLRADGHEVVTTWSFGAFLRRIGWADWALVNATKHDSPKYIWKILLSVLLARLRRRRVAVFVTIDLVDLCDRPVVRRVLSSINHLALRAASLVILLATREHVMRRYGLKREKVLLVYNCPDRNLFRPTPHVEHSRETPILFLYHGELLWWHGLERFIPVYEEIRGRRPARLIVCGNFYPSVFRLFGFVASRREVKAKRRLAEILARPGVEYLGRVSLDALKQRMAEADFHVSLMNDEDEQARTELRTGLLEAMLAGMACLHAPTPGLPAGIFRDGENVVMMDSRDPLAAAEKILRLYDSPEALSAIRRNATATIEAHFDMDAEYRKVAERLSG
jgi:glycosyltransferase involved in cell wall biosynthesis